MKDTIFSYEDIYLGSKLLDQTPSNLHHTFMLIYKIFRPDEWASMQTNGQTHGAPIDLADGFVHFSTAGQARETASKHFVGETGLWLVAAETERMADLKWEVSRGGAEFPHLYAPFEMIHVVWAKELPLTDAGHDFPADMQ